MLLENLCSEALVGYSLPWQLFYLVFLVEREMVMKILALQDFYELLIYFVFISINVTFNQLTRLKHYLPSIGPLGY